MGQKVNYLLSSILMVCCICVLAFANDIVPKGTAQPQDSQASAASFGTLAALLNQLDEIVLHIRQSENNLTQKKELLAQKEVLMQQLITGICDRKQPLGFHDSQIKQRQMQATMQHEDSRTQNDSYMQTQSSIALNTALIESHTSTLFANLRKQIDFFSQKQKVLDIIKPTLSALHEMPTTFPIDTAWTLAQQQTIQAQIEQYHSKLATAIEIATYFEWHADSFVPQNTLLHASMRYTLQVLSNFIEVSHDTLATIKFILSLLCFVFLWACRKLITKAVVYCMDLIMHLTNQDKDLHTAIQMNLLRPISLCLLVWSLRVCVGVLYYPQLQPEELDVWFLILYVVNIAWFVVALVKSYGTVLLTNLLQKSNSEFRKEIINLFLKVIYSVIIIIAILLILKLLGFNVSAIIASLGLGGLAVALAVKDILANFFASVMLLFDNSFSQGDWIECGGIDGVVVEIGLRRTSVRTADNALLFVPNSELAGKVIRNWSRRKAGRRIKMSIGVTYDANEAQLKLCVEKIESMLRNHAGIITQLDYTQDELRLLALRKDIISLDDFLGYKGGLFVCVESLADSSINILVDCFTRSVSKKDFFAVREDVIFQVMAIVQECGLSFAFPSQSIYVEALPKKQGITIAKS